MTTDLSDIENSPIPGVTAPSIEERFLAMKAEIVTPERVAQGLVNVGEIDRRTYIGGSRAPVILGLDPYGRTPLTEYEKIIGESESQGYDAETLAFFEWRKEWEPVVVKRIKREFNAQVVGENRRFIDPEHDFFAAEIDFEWVDENGEIQNGEIKTVHPIAFRESAGWGEEGTDQCPIHYAAQCMWGLGVTGRKVCILVAMAGIDKFVFYRIERDEETIAAMREACRSFWVDNVLAKIPPDPINMADISRLCVKLTGRPVEIDEPTLKALRDLQAARDLAKSSEEAVEELQFQVARYVLKQWSLPEDAPAEVGENAELRFGGQKVGTWNKQPHSHLDQKRLAEELPDVKAQYTKTKTIRVMRVTKPKKG